MFLFIVSNPFKIVIEVCHRSLNLTNLLYHRTNKLSIGFSKNFSKARAKLPPLLIGYCIVHNPLLLQPLRHWFTFISRKHEHLAVEDFIVKVLSDSHGSCLLASALLPSFWIKYTILGVVCQDLFSNFFENFILPSRWLAPSPLVHL